MTNEILELITESYETGNITLEEANYLVDKISEDNAGKGVNRTYINATKTLAKEYKEAKKKIKKHISSKEFDKARESINDARAQLRELKSYINGLPREIKDDVLSHAIPALAGVLGGVAATVGMSDGDTRNVVSGIGASLGYGAMSAGVSVANAYVKGSDINNFKSELDRRISKEEKMLDKMDKLLAKKEIKYQ